MQGLRSNWKLTKGEFDLRVGNSARVAIIAIWTHFLNLLSDLCKTLNDCFLCTSIEKNIS